MNFGLSSTTLLSDVASNTTGVISGVSTPVELILGVLLAFLVIGFIIETMDERAYRRTLGRAREVSAETHELIH